MKKIQPIVFPLNQGTATHIFVRVLPYDLYSNQAKVFVVFLNVPDVQVPAGAAIPSTEVTKLNLDLPTEIVQAWGTDDDVVMNYVASQLDVTIIEEEAPAA